MKLLKIALLVFLLAIFISPGMANADNDSARLEELNKQIEEYAKRLSELKSESDSLSNQIAKFNANIRLTELRIDQTEEKILLLGGRIDQLGVSLKNLSDAFSSRAVETYKIARVGENPILFVTSEDINETVSRYYYLQRIQSADQALLERLQTAQDTYVEQKVSLEALQTELESQNKVLGAQKAAKADLLRTTKNDEKKYQELLENAKAEFEAIQAIVAGRGEEHDVGHVEAGQRVASIIQGASCNSSGAHLHFIVSQKGNALNPFNYLKNGVNHQNCSGAGECSAGDVFNPSGSWEWPISPTIRYTQGFGSTWATQNTWVGRVYSFHNGIDIDSESSPEVRAVQKGTLYQGSFTGSGGCRLRYVRVDHDDSDLETFYLHINY